MSESTKGLKSIPLNDLQILADAFTSCADEVKETIRENFSAGFVEISKFPAMLQKSKDTLRVLKTIRNQANAKRICRQLRQTLPGPKMEGSANW
jgi:hypothetical protein